MEVNPGSIHPTMENSQMRLIYNFSNFLRFIFIHIVGYLFDIFDLQCNFSRIPSVIIFTTNARNNVLLMCH